MANDNAVLLIDAVSSSRFHEVPSKIMKGAQFLGGPTGMVSSSLKRKRPPKIDIPNVLREISADIFKGRAAQVQGGGGDGGVCFSACGVGVSSLKGKKKFMEDAHKIFPSSTGNMVGAKLNLFFFVIYWRPISAVVGELSCFCLWNAGVFWGV